MHMLRIAMRWLVDFAPLEDTDMNNELSDVVASEASGYCLEKLQNGTTKLQLINPMTLYVPLKSIYQYVPHKAVAEVSKIGNL